MHLVVVAVYFLLWAWTEGSKMPHWTSLRHPDWVTVTALATRLIIPASSRWIHSMSSRPCEPSTSCCVFLNQTSCMHELSRANYSAVLPSNFGYVQDAPRIQWAWCELPFLGILARSIRSKHKILSGKLIHNQSILGLLKSFAMDLGQKSNLGLAK